MKRRVNLIAGILHDPKILFLDEPTVGVDVQSRNVIIEHLKEINDAGTTIIILQSSYGRSREFLHPCFYYRSWKNFNTGYPAELISNNAGSTNLENVFLNLTNRKLRD